VRTAVQTKRGIGPDCTGIDTLLGWSPRRASRLDDDTSPVGHESLRVRLGIITDESFICFSD